MQGSNLRANAVFIRVRGRLTLKYTHKVSVWNRNWLKSWLRGQNSRTRSRLAVLGIVRSVAPPKPAATPIPKRSGKIQSASMNS